MLDVPDVIDYGWPEESEYEVRIKAGGGHTSIFYRNDPLKIVGWKGDLFPYKFNVKSILPIMSNRIHLAPSSWATFEAAGFVVVSFMPQIAVADLDAEELPSYHRNIDMDEVILSHANDDPGGRRPGAASALRRRASCTAPPKKPAPRSTPGASPATCAAGPASASTSTARSRCRTRSRR
jgi:homogentisate 1,2-dioxygenase